MRTLFLLVLSVTLGLAACAARAEERLDIEACAYPDNAAAAAAWQPQDGTDPVTLARERTPDGKPALAFRCDMPRLQQRAYWDRAVKLDLARFGRIAFWVKAVGDRSAATGCNLYFHAGEGWYAASFGLPETGWQRVVLDRASFRSEDTPAGWQAIQGMRLGAWKGQPRQVTLLIGGMEALADDVVIVRNARGEKESLSFAARMAAALARAGVAAGAVDDTDVEAGVLTGKRIAIYPQNPRPTDKELDALDTFVQGGGRLIVCYALPPRLAALLGIEMTGYLKSEYPGQFSSMRFQGGGIPGLPAEAKQDSWNINKVRPVGKGARVLAEWYDKDGNDTGYPAILLSDTGAYISHVLLEDDQENKDRLLRALLGHLCPDVWKQVAQGALAQAGQLSRWQSFDQVEKGIRDTAKRAGRAKDVAELLTRARQSYQQAEKQLQAGKYPEVLEPATLARRDLLDAYARCQPARAKEFRAVWCHSAYGVAGMTWDEAIRRLKESGFNAIMPNMLWGGLADYQSKLLPIRDRVAKEGDQIALCVAAGKKYGVAVHVWKVNWNLSNAPQEFVARMRAEGRLQRTDKGEEQAWLCPSNPDNFALERDTMLEVARNYDVDGIHFDYIRYPDQSHCYCEGCRKRFEASAGTPVANWPADVLKGGPQYAAYQEFRRANITRLVKAVSEAARRLKPGIKVSAAVFSNWPECRESIGQDWGEWVRQGYLDFICPMDYTDSNSGYRAMVQVQRDAVGGRIPLVAGVGASAPGLPLDQVIDQIQIARTEGANGFIIFNYAGVVASEYLPALGLGTTKGNTPIPYKR